MNESLIVFREQDYYFGLFPADFDSHFSMDGIHSYPSDISSSIWHFERNESPTKGVYVHLGALIANSPIFFSFSGHIFVKQIPDFCDSLEPDLFFGVLMDNFYKQLSPLELSQKRLGLDQLSNLPANLPKKAFRYALLYKKKKILIVDPLELMRSYKTLFPSNI